MVIRKNNCDIAEVASSYWADNFKKKKKKGGSVCCVGEGVDSAGFLHQEYLTVPSQQEGNRSYSSLLSRFVF